jgi:hypothetical protein
VRDVFVVRAGVALGEAGEALLESLGFEREAVRFAHYRG